MLRGRHAPRLGERYRLLRSGRRTACHRRRRVTRQPSRRALPNAELCRTSSNEKEITHGKVSWQTRGGHSDVEPLDAMKGCKAWAKPAHALYEKQHNNPS